MSRAPNAETPDLLDLDTVDPYRAHTIELLRTVRSVGFRKLLCLRPGLDFFLGRARLTGGSWARADLGPLVGGSWDLATTYKWA